MSLLNLNSPAGRGPRGKSSSRAWMGIGLVIAVLGIGSTLAANITLNSPEGTTEFGQGVTQSVYCGGDQSVTITPISSYSNTQIGSGTPEVQEGSFLARFISSYGSSENRTELTRTTINDDEDDNFPRFNSGSNTRNGWWLSGPTSSATIYSPQPSIATVKLNPSNYYFALETSSGSGKYKKGSGSSTNFSEVKVITSARVAAVPGPTIPASFSLGGVVISDIPLACEGVNFIISSYAQTGAAQTLISSGSDIVKEVAVHWTGADNASAISSKDRTSLVTSSLVTATQKTDSLKVVLNTSSGTALAAADLYKLVVETQEDAIS
jgi:hypothetical protein